MLSFLLLSVISLEVTHREGCKANIDGNLYDLSMLSSASPLYKKVIGNWTYYYAICRELQAQEIGSLIDPDGYSVARVHAVTQETQLLITKSAFDFKFLKRDDPNNGLTFIGHGEPVKDSELGQYRTFDLVHEMQCDPTQTTPQISILFNFDDDEADVRIRASSSTSYGCPKKDIVPTPTPAFNPDCKFRYRLPSLPSMGLSFDLATMNDGPGGIRVPLNISNTEFVLFYQPCERMKCPIEKSQCEDTEYSSAWLCNKALTHCDSYGVAKDDLDVDPVNPSLYDGVYITHHGIETSRSIRHHVKSDIDVPAGHFLFAKDAKFAANQQLQITSVSSDMNLKTIDEPVIPVGGNCSFKVSKDKAFLSINLARLNKDDGGWVKHVDILQTKTKNEFTLHYQPCGFMFCPKGTSCDGDEDATVWLCINGQTAGTYEECIGYGLFEHNVSVDLIAGDINNGIVANYQGDDRRTAHVRYICDDSLGEEEIGLPDDVLLEGAKLSFNVTAKRACVVGPTPTPLPTLYPSIPTPDPNPTPGPVPQPMHIFYNASMYIQIDMSLVSQDVVRERTKLVSRGLYNDMYTEFSPWQKIPPPQGYGNPYGVPSANVWGCWNDELGRNVCYSIGDKDISFSARNDDFDKGVVVRYDGYNGVDAEFIIECDMNMVTDTIKFSDFVTSYHLALDGPEFGYSAKSPVVCPKLFAVIIPTPNPNPTPSPDPKYVPVTFAESEKVNGKVISLDLNNISAFSDYVILGHSEVAERPMIYYSPRRAMRCPKQYTCDEPGKANLWKCFNIRQTGRKMCFSGGSNMYGVDIALSTSDSKATVTYKGADEGRKTIIEFTCDETLDYSKITFKDFNLQIGEEDLYLYANSKQLCWHTPVAPVPTPTPRPRVRPSSGGAVFLAGVMIAALAYVSFGVGFKFVSGGEVAIPNATFWSEFAACVATGAIYVVSLGKKTSQSTSYDAI